MLFTFILPAVLLAQNRNTKPQPYKKLEESKNQIDFSLSEAKKSALDALHLCETATDDSLKIEILLQLGNITSLQGDKTSGLKHFEEAYDLSKQKAYAFGECRALLEIGYIHYAWGEYDLSLTFFEKALAITQENQFKEEEANALNLLGKYYHTRGFFDKSVEYYKKAIETNHNLSNNDQSINLYLNIGKTYISEGDIYMTLSYYLKAYDASEKTNNQLLKADVYNHLGSLYLLLKQPLKSLEYHRGALALRLAMKEPQATSTSYNNIGETYLYIGKYDSAAVNFTHSYHLCVQTSYLKGTIKALTNLGRTENKTGSLDQAYNHLKKALDMASNSGYDAGIVESSLTIGQNFIIKKDYVQAIGYFEKSLSKMNEANLNEFQSDAYFGLYKCYRELGDNNKSLYYHEKFAMADRNLLMAESDRQLSELRVQFDLQKKENDNQKLRQENELKQLVLTKRNWVIWSVATMLLFTLALCLLIYTRYVQKRKLNSELQRVVSELEQANIEKDKMFSIIAHELRNPLYWFQNLSEVLSKNYKNMSEEKLQKSLAAIDESAKNAFHLMDNLLNWSRARLKRITPRRANHSLQQIVNETIRMYTTIIHQKEIDLNLSVPPEAMVFTDADMFACILRNLVSNAIKYTPVGGMISISVHSDKSHYILSIADTGIGMDANQLSAISDKLFFDPAPGLLLEKGSGLGLKLCFEFVMLTGGRIWANRNNENGTSISFTIPNTVQN